MFLIESLNSCKVKTHDLRKFERGLDYFVDFTKTGESATITTALAIKKGDKVILPYHQQALTYCVDELEDYWNDNNIKTIFLNKISETV